MLIYIHYPHCIRRCNYCDFAISPGKCFPAVEYTDQIIAELRSRLNSEDVQTVYIGGGTPSLWPLAELRRVVEALRDVTKISSATEWTIEVNPEMLTGPQCAEYTDLGFTRMSLGAQSLQIETLRRLSREHTRKDVQQAIDVASCAGIENINVDLIVGLSGQPFSGIREDIETLCKLGVDHFSVYALQAAPKSRFCASGDRPAVDDQVAKALYAARELLEQKSLRQYEVSNYSRDAPCRHNMLTWSGCSYIGLGAGAHSAIPSGTETIRIRNTALNRYLKSSFSRKQSRGFAKALDSPLTCADSARIFVSNFQESVLETVMVQLRRIQGIDRKAFENRFGFDIVDSNESFWQPYVDRQYLYILDQAIAPTPTGIWFADGIAANFPHSSSICSS